MFSGCWRQTFLCASPQKWKSRGFKSGEWTGQMIEVPRLMTRFWNLLSRNSLASVVQWGGAPSCIHQYLFLVAVDRRACHTVSYNNWRSQDPSTETDLPFPSMKACMTGIFPSMMATNIIIFLSLRSFVSTISCGFLWAWEHQQLDRMCQRLRSMLRQDNHQESGGERFEACKTFSALMAGTFQHLLK